MDEKNPKKIEVVNGDGKDLDISPVYDHIDIENPRKNKENKKIIVPEEKRNS